MAPVEKRVTMSATDSTSSIGTGPPAAGRRRMRPRSVPSLDAWSSTADVYSLKIVVLLGAGGVLQLEHGARIEEMELSFAAPLVLAADLELAVGPLGRAGLVGGPVPRRHLGRQDGETDAADARGRPGEVLVDRAAPSRPMASKTWAPVYEATVEIPIFDITLSTPLQQALM